MTIDELARITQNGFAEVTKHLEKHDDQFKVVVNRLDTIEADVKDVKRTLSSVVKMTGEFIN